MRPERSAGFTLLEVLIALAIFAMTAVVLALAYLNVIHGYAAVSHGTGQDRDVAFARQELLQQVDLQTAINGDEFDTQDADGNDRHLKWSADIEPTTMPDLFTVTFTCQITAPNQAAPRTVTQVFTLLRPTWSDPADRSKLRGADIDRIMQLQGRRQ